ncbi:carbohydrate ABC transporter permease [Paenibacillus eucommiae]|uniref:ABC-type glycerol-3-phosphate transport system permease component n=1 Tax=Paenibacillus eucommiae TaxID=1355755 RepID=A0ABS4J068_9BACL|nr:carbohydrate ABC transporter permease [Paenibacillus eucommiae]MBP1993201.1 ABC-type glycerol-3-phosphate transport system permease component [Paenibacillus eucommiae]
MPNYNKDWIFQLINNSLILILSVTMLAPLIHLLAVSLSNPLYASAKLVYFWPKGFQTDVYETILGMKLLWRSMGNTIYITVVGTALTLFIGTMLSFALSRPAMKGRKLILKAIVLTFIFSAPLIPSYLTVRELGLMNTLWALIIPGALSAFYIIIFKTFFQGISSELFDACKMDGCSEWRIYYRIILPLSKPVLATIGMFHAVGQWNSYFGAMLYIRDLGKQPLMLVLRSLVVEDDMNKLVNISKAVQMATTPTQLKAGIILFSILPILCVYPFLQKHFVKGAQLGSLKE